MPDEYDSPWKDMLTIYFEQFMEFFFPEIYQKIDWSKGYTSLDKELHQIIREAEIGKRLADKLFRVWGKDGKERWVLVHVEVQSQWEKDFAQRTYIYNYRILDLYNYDVASLAVLADELPNWRPSVYSKKTWGCDTEFHFPIVKILDYRENTDELEKSDNPFSVVVATHLKTMETKKDNHSRWKWKIRIAKALYRRGFNRHDVLNLFHFIDWIMVLPKDLENSFYKEILDFEEEQKMRFINIAERTGIKKGIEQGMEQGMEIGREEGAFSIIIKQLNRRFGSVPPSLESRLKLSGKKALEDLAISMFDFKDLGDVEKWWKKHGKQ